MRELNLAKPVSATQMQQLMLNGQPNMKGFINIFVAILISIVLIVGAVIVGNEIINKKIDERIKDVSVRFNGGNGLLGTATKTSAFNYPTSTYSFQDNDTMNAGDFNEWLRWTGIRNATDTDSISYKLSSSSSDNPGHKHSILTTSTIPTTSTSTCTAGNFSWDATYFYFCATSSSWRRATSTTF